MKNTKHENLKLLIGERLKRNLAEVPFLEVEEIREQELQGKNHPDIVFLTNKDNRSKYIIVEIKTLGEPRNARYAIQQLREYLSNYNNAYGVMGAPFISSETSRLCKENGIGYIDNAGNCFLSFSDIFIERENFPNPNKERKRHRSVFSKKASRIVRAMLCKPNRQWRIKELASEADVSLGLTFKVKERLLNLEYAREDKKKVFLVEPQKLLEKWSNYYDFRKNRLHDCYGFGSVREIEQRFTEHCKNKKIQFALSLFSGAALVSPFARYTRGFAYAQEDVEHIIDDLDLKKVDSGANFTLMEPYDDGIFYNKQEVKGSIVVCDIQLYIDLVGYKGRGEDAAQFLFEQIIKPKW
jgi:hypothetical protein